MVDMFVYYFTKYGIPIFLMVGMIWFMTSLLPDMLDTTLGIIEKEEQETQDVQTNTTEQETNETVNGTGTI